MAKRKFTDNQLLELKTRLEAAQNELGEHETLSKAAIEEITDKFAGELTEQEKKLAEIKNMVDPMMPSEKPNK